MKTTSEVVERFAQIAKEKWPIILIFIDTDGDLVCETNIQFPGNVTDILKTLLAEREKRRGNA